MIPLIHLLDDKAVIDPSMITAVVKSASPGGTTHLHVSVLGALAAISITYPSADAAAADHARLIHAWTAAREVSGLPHHTLSKGSPA